MAHIHAFAAVTAAGLKLYYRSTDNIRQALIGPLVIVAFVALLGDLRFSFDQGGSVDLFTFIAVGMVAFWPAHLAQNGMTGAAAGYKAQGILRRIAATPLSPAVFVSAQALTRVIVGIAQVAVMLVAVTAFGVDVEYGPQLLWVVPLTAIAVATALGFAFAIAGVTTSLEAANQANLLLNVPIMVFAGIMYPLAGLPDTVADIAHYAMPFASYILAMRGIVLDGAGVADYGAEVIASTAWMLAALLIAVRAYRFEDA